MGYVRDNATAGSWEAAAGSTQPPFTLVIEKVDPEKAGCGFSSKGAYAVSSETARFQLANQALAGVGLAVWRSNFQAGTFMVKGDDVVVGSDGAFQLVVNVDDVITLSTTTGQANGNTTDPSPAADDPWPNVWSDDFEQYAEGAEGKFWAQASGAFEVVADETTCTSGACARAEPNRVLKQTAVG